MTDSNDVPAGAIELTEEDSKDMRIRMSVVSAKTGKPIGVMEWTWGQVEMAAFMAQGSGNFPTPKLYMNAEGRNLYGKKIIMPPSGEETPS